MTVNHGRTLTTAGVDAGSSAIKVALMRHPDGVHLVREGGEKAARAIIRAIQEEAGLIPKP